MIDGRFGALTGRFWEFLARGLVRAGLSPNTVTLLGLTLVAALSGLFVLQQNALVYAAGLTLAFSFDGLDGAVARLTGKCSAFGGYLDAVVDRYQDLLVLAALAHVYDAWPAAFCVAAGAMLTSYNKARVALEMPIDNQNWPDLLERMERLILIIALLLLTHFVPVLPWGGATVHAGLWLLAVLTHFTAVQRFFRARGRLLAQTKNAGNTTR